MFVALKLDEKVGFCYHYDKPNEPIVKWATEKAIKHLTKDLIQKPLRGPPGTRMPSPRCSLPPGGENIPDHSQQSGKSNQTRHRSGLGPGRPGYTSKILWVYSQQYQGKTHEFGVHRPYRRQIAASAEVFRGCQFLIAALSILSFSF